MSENVQGMLLHKWALTSQGPKKGSSLVQVTGDSSTLISKIESVVEHQALEKDHLDVVNKQWGAKLEAIEGLIKMLLSQAQEKPLSAFVQNLGMGYRSGNNFEPPGRPLKNFSCGAELICVRCGESGHFQNNCEQVKALFTKGAIVHNKEGRVCLPDGLWVPNIPTGS